MLLLDALVGVATRGMLIAALCAGTGALANDRPYQIARTAVMEDDEQVWAAETWIEQRGPVRGLSVGPEYTFDTANSLQLQLSRYVDRNGDATGHEAEVEYKHLFNHIGRDGWAMGFSVALGVEQSAEAGRTRRLGLKLPFSVAVGEGGYLHLSPGWTGASDAARAWTLAVAVEYPVWRRTTAFAEAAHEGSLRYAQLGVRHWIRREKLAIDFAWQQQGIDGRLDRGFIVGLSLYDL